MSSSTEALVLCLYAGGTIGMVRKDATSGFAPYPSFLTETLRSQSRFHDPHGDSIFSWSDSVDRYKAWSEAYTRPGSGASTPIVSTDEVETQTTPSASSIANGLSAQIQNNRHHEASMARQSRSKSRGDASTNRPTARFNHIYADSSASGDSAGHGAGGAAPFGHPVMVRSSAPKGTSTHHALSSLLSADGQCLELQLPTLLTPRAGAHGKRVRYAVLEYDPLLDSSEMDIPDWIRLASDISLNYQNFDSFIVLHGTDTMAYTASALSMLLENLGKSVIVTGAQVPLSELRNDAIENVLGALMLAGSYIIPEVGLYFASTLYRGNRTSKVSNNALAAFDSPNMAPLARVGIHIDVAWNLVERSKTLHAFRAHDQMSSNVAVLRLFPGLSTSTVKSFLSPPLQGVILESYGAGNAPSRADLLQVFREASDRGLVIVNITQCVQGEVSAIYATGKKLEAVGVVAGGDMTPECALAKLSYLLAKGLEPGEIRDLMGRPLRGELTSTRNNASNAHTKPTELTPAMGPVKTDLKMLLAHILQNPGTSRLSSTIVSEQRTPSSSGIEGRDPEQVGTAAAWDRSSQELSTATLTILPYLVYEAASNNDIAMLQWHLNALTQLEAVPTLVIDDEHFHPLKAGGNFALESSTPGITGDSAAADTDASGPGSGSVAAGSGSTSPLEKLQPLHVASARGFSQVVEILLQAGCSVHARDINSGHSPLFLAAKNGNRETVEMLKNAGGHLKEDEVTLARTLVQLERELAQIETTKAIWQLAGISIP